MNKLQKHILQAAGLLTAVLVIAAAGHHMPSRRRKSASFRPASW